MNFFAAVDARRSVRSFLDKKVEDEKLQKILAAAMSAPSAGNLQSYDIVVVKSKESRKKLDAVRKLIKAPDYIQTTKECIYVLLFDIFRKQSFLIC